MAALSSSFVPILAVMSGEAEQMEKQQTSAEQMEASLIALLAGESFDWAKPAEEFASSGELAVGGPEPETEDVAPAPAETAPPTEETVDSEPMQLEMDFDGLEADEALIDGRR
ncbi:MAG: hypothetical protein AAGM33_11415, partial [Pseudomonadota bacterium]